MNSTDTRHIISTKFFTLALTITDEEFKRREKEFNDKGIKRLRASQIGYYSNIISGFDSLAYTLNPYFTIIENVKVDFSEKQGITLSNLESNFNFLIINSKIPFLNLSNTQRPNVIDNNFSNLTSIWIANSEGEGFMLKNCDVSQLEFGNSTINTIYITESNIREIGFQRKCTIKHTQINNDVKIQSFRLSESTLNSFGSEYVQFEYLSFSNSKIDKIYFNHTVISNQIDFVSSTLGNIYISEFCIIRRLQLRDITGKNIYSDYANSIGTLDVISSQVGKITYMAPCPCGEIKVSESTVDALKINSISLSKVILSKSEFKEILFSHCSSIIFTEINSVKCNSVNFDNCGFYELNLKSNLNKDNLLILSKIKVFIMNIDYFSSILGFLLIKQMRTIIPDQPVNYNIFDKEKDPIDEKLPFEEKRRIHEKKFQHTLSIDKSQLIKELLIKYQKPTFILNQSSLGKAEFTDCDLASFDFQFNNSKITEIFISGGSVPSENIQIYNVEQNTLAWHEQKVSAYSQLKKVFDSQGDIFWSSHFQSKTGKHQSKVLEQRLQQEANQTKSLNDKIKNLFSTNRFDWISFQLNHYSNLHGENWGRALAFTLFLPAFLYILYLIIVGRIFLFHNPINLNLIGYYFSFLDPTHKTDFLEDSKDLNGWARFIDFLSRIVVSYGIYQLIVAFRKHGKKT